MSDLISRQAAIDGVIKSCFGQANVVQAEAAVIQYIKRIPPVQPERKTGRWNRMMMYLADLQLTYSPGWGSNGCGDEKLYEFVTGLIEELEGWSMEAEHEQN